VGRKLVVDSLSQQVRRLGSPSVVEAIELDPGLFGPDLRDYPQTRSNDGFLVRYPALFFDREARLRGLVIGAARDIAVVTGDSGGPAAALASLSRMTGQAYKTPEEWVAWWSRSAGHLALSGDGRRLVVTTL
jgi:hypothetical protein